MMALKVIHKDEWMVVVGFVVGEGEVIEETMTIGEWSKLIANPKVIEEDA